MQCSVLRTKLPPFSDKLLVPITLPQEEHKEEFKNPSLFYLDQDCLSPCFILLHQHLQLQLLPILLPRVDIMPIKYKKFHFKMYKLSNYDCYLIYLFNTFRNRRMDILASPGRKCKENKMHFLSLSYNFNFLQSQLCQN